MKNGKIALSMLLALCMALMLLPAAAVADEPVDVSVFDDTSEADAGSTWEYDHTTRTLTINQNGVTLTGKNINLRVVTAAGVNSITLSGLEMIAPPKQNALTCEATGTMTVSLIGDSTLTGGDGASESAGGYGLVAEGSLVFSGSGTLAAIGGSGGDSTSPGSTGGAGGGGIKAVGDMAVSGTLDAAGGDGGGATGGSGSTGGAGGSGVYAGGSLSISGSLAAAGGNGSGVPGGGNTAGAGGIGVYAGGLDVTGVLTANGGTGGDGYIGGAGGTATYADGGLSITGTLAANGGNGGTGDNGAGGGGGTGGIGIKAAGDVAVSGMLTASGGGGGTARYSGAGGHGVDIGGSISGGGTLTANGGAGGYAGGGGTGGSGGAGIAATGSINFSGTLTAGGGAGGYSSGTGGPSVRGGTGGDGVVAADITYSGNSTFTANGGVGGSSSKGSAGSGGNGVVAQAGAVKNTGGGTLTGIGGDGGDSSSYNAGAGGSGVYAGGSLSISGTLYAAGGSGGSGATGPGAGGVAISATEVVASAPAIVNMTQSAASTLSFTRQNAGAPNWVVAPDTALASGTLADTTITVSHSGGGEQVTVSLGAGTTTPIPGPDLFAPTNHSGITYLNRTLTDAPTGVTVSGRMTSGARLTVRERVLHIEGACAACDEIRERQAAGEVIVLYDIALSGGNMGELMVSIPVGSQYDGQTLTILHCNNGKLESVSATVTGGMATGLFKSLSPFAVVGEMRVAVPDEVVQDAPKTGDSLNVLGFAMLALCAVAVINRKLKMKN